MLARPCLNLLRAASLSLGLAAIGCGGNPTVAPQPDLGTHAISTPYALVIGSHASSFTLDPSKAHVVCTPKPGLQEFVFEGTIDSGADAGKYFRLTLEGYTGANKDYRLDYKPASVQHKVEVGFPAAPPAVKGYKYKFFQAARADANVTYPSHCDLSIKSEGLTDRIKFTGTMNCSPLWADQDSADYQLQPLNGFVDLIAKFECEQQI